MAEPQNKKIADQKNVVKSEIELNNGSAVIEVYLSNQDNPNQKAEPAKANVEQIHIEDKKDLIVFHKPKINVKNAAVDSGNERKTKLIVRRNIITGEVALEEVPMRMIVRPYLPIDQDSQINVRPVNPNKKTPASVKRNLFGNDADDKKSTLGPSASKKPKTN